MRSLHKRSEIKIQFVSGKTIPPQFYKDAIINSDPWKTLFKNKKMAKDIVRPGEKLILAKVNSNTVGLALWTPNFLRGGYLRVLSIHPDYRRLGVGKKLMVEFEKQVFKKYSNSYLCVSSFNYSARTFYRNLGYSIIGVIKKLVHPKYDEIFMRKTRR